MRTSNILLSTIIVFGAHHSLGFTTSTLQTLSNPVATKSYSPVKQIYPERMSQPFIGASEKEQHRNKYLNMSLSSSEQERRKKIQGVHPFISKAFSNVFSSLDQNKIKSIMVAATIMISLLFTPLQDAMAAPSGGRMGGSFGGSDRSSSSYSRSYSSPTRSYTRSYSSGGYYSRPNIIVAPPQPIFGGGYGFFGAPIVRPGVTVVSTGPTLLNFLSTAFIGLVLFSTISSFTRSQWDDTGNTSTESALGPGVTVAQVSVALNVPRRNDSSSILMYLDRLSASARTDSRVGVSNLVSQVALELLRQKRSIFAADANFKHYKDGNSAQREFNSMAIRERSKFERESISKFGGVDYAERGTRRITDGFNPQATAAVVTLLISIDGDSTKLPRINSIGDLEKALTRIATDVKVDDCLRSAEVLWTPEDPNDVLTERDVTADYPKLRTI